MNRYYILTLSLLISISGWSQLSGLRIKKATGHIVIDGEMNEEDWHGAEVAGHFKQMFPFDSSYALAQTEVRMTYDDRFIYLFLSCTMRPESVNM